jgi:hypothetical protein
MNLVVGRGQGRSDGAIDNQSHSEGVSVSDQRKIVIIVSQRRGDGDGVSQSHGDGVSVTETNLVLNSVIGEC